VKNLAGLADGPTQREVARGGCLFCFVGQSAIAGAVYRDSLLAFRVRTERGNK